MPTGATLLWRLHYPRSVQGDSPVWLELLAGRAETRLGRGQEGSERTGVGLSVTASPALRVCVCVHVCGRVLTRALSPRPF